MSKRANITVVLAGLALLLTACKEVDTGATNAVLVHGTDALYRFCDGPTLVYFTDWDGDDDEFEAIWPGLCRWDEGAKRWTYSEELAKVSPAQNGNAPDDE